MKGEGEGKRGEGEEGRRGEGKGGNVSQVERKGRKREGTNTKF